MSTGRRRWPTTSRRPRRSLAEHGLAVESFQSNHEGELVDAIHGARRRCAAIIINPGAFTHYAWSIHDALAAFDGPIVELHLSNPNAREPWRHTSVVAPVAKGSIVGFGGHGYALAAAAVAELLGERRMTAVAAADRLRLAAGRRARRARRHARSSCRRPSNIRWLTSFGGSLGWVVVGPRAMQPRHRRPLRRARRGRPRRRRSGRHRRRRRRHDAPADPRPRRRPGRRRPAPTCAPRPAT